MAIKAITTSNVECVNSKLDGGIFGIIYDYTKPTKKETHYNKSIWNKFASLFKTTQNKVGNTLNNNKNLSGKYNDNYLWTDIHIFGQSGSNGNLYFLSFEDKNKANVFITDVYRKGFISNIISTTYDFYICDNNNRKSLPCSWLHQLIVEDAPVDLDCIIASNFYYIIYPYRASLELTNITQNGYHTIVNLSLNNTKIYQRGKYTCSI